MVMKGLRFDAPVSIALAKKGKIKAIAHANGFMLIPRNV